MAVSFPILSDWRDRRRLQLLDTLYPTLSCPSCGAPIPVPNPVLVLRPTDPIPVLFCVTSGAPEHVDALQRVLAEQVADEHGRVVGPIANTDPALLGVVADRYTGFQLLRLPGPDQEWADDDPIRGWFSSLRAQHSWPDVAGIVNEFLSADSDEAAGRVMHQHPVLTDPTWEPVVRWIGTRTAAAQPTAEQSAAVRGRLRLLGRWRLGGPGLDLDAPAAREAFGLLEQVVSLQSAAARTPQDVTRGISLGDTLIDLSTNHYGPDHPLTLTAMNDTAALLLDDADSPEAATARARALLQRVRSAAIGQRSAALADATTNLGLAQLRRDRIADADAGEAAIELLHDALHLQRLFYPDEPERSVSALSNLGALIRSRLTGDPVTNTAEAIRLLRRAQQLTTGPRRLTVPDEITLQTNLLSALADRATQDPSDAHDLAVLEAIDALETTLTELGAEHPARIQAYTNLGSISLGLLYRASRVVPAELLTRARGWLAAAYEGTRHLAADDATRVLAASNLAAVHFRLGGEPDLQRARELLAECVTALRDSQSTRLHHTVFANLAQLHLVDGDWDAAVAVLEAACRHADAVIGRAAIAATRLAQVAAAGDLYQRLALLHAHRRNAQAAIHTIERSRARWRTAHTGPFDPDEVDRAVAARLRPGTALLYAGTCGVGSYAVVLVGGSGAGAWTTRTTTADLAPLLRALHDAHTLTEVAPVLDAAAARIGADLVAQALRILRSAGVSRLSIVASGALAGLPLAALPGPDGALAEIGTVDYLIGAVPADGAADVSAADEPTADGQLDTSAAAIINPTGDLPFADSEATALRRYAPAAVTPPPSAGLRGWLLAQLAQVRHLHLACHAIYEPKDPFASRLILGDGLTVTVADLAQVATPQLAMVVASCCQTAIVDQRGADELIGLAHTLIAAGARSAVAALWEIDDAATSLLIARFYDRLTTGLAPADALAEAQQQLRTATMRQLAELARASNDTSWVPDELRRELRALAVHPQLRDPDTRPFSHSAAWAGLVYLAP